MKLKVPRVEPALLALFGEGFLSRLSFGLVSFALPLYAFHIGMSMTAIGFLFGINSVAEVSMKPFMSRFADRYGFKKSLGLAIGARSVLALLLVFADAPLHLYALRLFLGVIESLRDPSINSMLAEQGGEESVASNFSWYWTARYTAGAMGKMFAGLLLAWSASNYKLIFFIAFVLSVLPFYVVLRYAKEEPRSQPTEKAAAASEPDPSGVVAAAPKVPIITFAGFGFLITSTSAMFNSLFPLLATQYAGLTEAQTGLIFGVSTTLMLIAGPVFGWLSDNVSRKLVLLVRSAGNTISSLVYLFFPTLAGVAIGKVVDDMGKAAFRPAWGALMARVSGADRSRRAQTIGTMTIGQNLGETLGPMFGGFLWSTYGVAVMLIVRAAVALSAELYAIFLVDPHITPKGALTDKPGA